MIRRCQHIGITVSNLERSLAFYRDLLGFKQDVAPMDASGDELSQALGVKNARLKLAVLSRGDLLVELIEYAAPASSGKAPRPSDVGCMHMALEVEDIQKTYKELSAKGVKFNTPPQRNAEQLSWAWWCYLKDPDGISVELVQTAP
jgi:catechol 2,3-dioxygenase-like lactoylglutathione lyase family enzyme